MKFRGSWSRALVLAVAVLVVIHVVGGLLAIATGVNEPGEAWGPPARMAAPWPMILFQVVTAGLAALGPWRRIAIGAAVLLAGACFVSGISGFFDGAFASEELSAWHVAYQVFLIGWTALVGALALARAVSLVRSAGPLEPRAAER